MTNLQDQQQETAAEYLYKYLRIRIIKLLRYVWLDIASLWPATRTRHRENANRLNEAIASGDDAIVTCIINDVGEAKRQVLKFLTSDSQSKVASMTFRYSQYLEFQDAIATDDDDIILYYFELQGSSFDQLCVYSQFGEWEKRIDLADKRKKALLIFWNALATGKQLNIVELSLTILQLVKSSPSLTQPEVRWINEAISTKLS